MIKRAIKKARAKRKQVAPDVVAELARVGAGMNPEMALISREIISADKDKVVWVETWDLDNPHCPLAVFGERDSNIFIMERAMTRESFEQVFGEIADRRVH